MVSPFKVLLGTGTAGPIGGSVIGSVNVTTPVRETPLVRYGLPQDTLLIWSLERGEEGGEGEEKGEEMRGEGSD